MASAPGPGDDDPANAAGGTGDVAEPESAKNAKAGEAGKPKQPEDKAGETPKSGSGKGAANFTEALKVIGGLAALSVGLLALVLIVIVALLVEPNSTGGSIMTAAIGVIGSMVGAYFGVKVGTDGTKTAIEAQQEEATKAQAFALHTPPDQAHKALASAKHLQEQAAQPGRASGGQQ